MVVFTSFLGCRYGDVHPLPEGHLRGLVPQPAFVEVPKEAPQGRGFRCEGSLTMSLPEEWRLESIMSWLDRAGLVWERTEGEVANWVIAEVDRDLGKEGYVLEVGQDRFALRLKMKRAPFALGPR